MKKVSETTSLSRQNYKNGRKFYYEIPNDKRKRERNTRQENIECENPLTLRIYEGHSVIIRKKGEEKRQTNLKLERKRKQKLSTLCS